ncbi:prepilin-type N-terminal cleavage/methylation domain-containing protein [Sporosarcina siberiensis]|uniref:Prepilin-type N-terminal cleavage/methylation domain-containing protein n=1 Tax=Sporosarcina siberiensis TaxID=1365606 RepID=A0ABW4SD33_9BACL
MLKKFNKHIKNEKGLTLIELLAVIVILAIVAAIAVPAIGNIITNAKVNALKADGQNVLAAASLYFVDGGASPVTDVQLITAGFLDDAGGFATTAGGLGASVTKVPNGSNTISGTSANSTNTVQFISATNATISATKNVSTGTVKITTP